MAVLATLGVSGRESNVLHAAAGRVPQEMIMRSRDYDEQKWDHYRERLARRGLLDGDGALTDAGRDLKQRIEDATDRLALSALDALDPYLLSTQFNAWQGILREPTYWDPIVRSAWVCALYAVPAIAWALTVFARRDVAGG